ncbi:MAG: NAD+ synthase [Vicinamibacterales bacterium]
MRIALAQLNLTVGAFDGNFQKIAGAVERAKAAAADLVVFSELATTGYPPRDLLTQPSFVDRNLAMLDRVAALSTASLAILIGYVDRNPSASGKPLYNAVALCSNGQVVERRHKLLLPTYDVFDEDRYFEPGSSVQPMTLADWHIGASICEDVWNDPSFWPQRRYHRDPVAELASSGVDVMINISASPFELQKADLRRRLIRQEAVKHKAYFFYVNQVGGNDELVFDGHSIGIDPDGNEIVRLKDFEEDFAVVDVPDARKPGPGVSRPGPEVRRPGPEDPALADTTSLLRPVSTSDEETAYRALVLGLRDYVRKCGFSSVVLGLSGGIDSALTACLAVDALGKEHVHTVAMPARYSSQHSLDDAAALAAALGVHHTVIPIDPVFQRYLDVLSPAFAGRDEDVTEQNIQARVRGGVLMALSNKFGHLLLTTGNKSELAVGYCTLYGDMCGGLAVISDVPKTLVYRLSRYVNRERTIIPESTLTKAPSAELRPNQTDQDTLPPYDVLDQIVEAYVERNLDADAIVARGIDAAVVRDVIRRIDGSEYKRRQAAPGIKLSTKAFGVGRRFPIAAEYSRGT